jgi:hypothetical protein
VALLREGISVGRQCIRRLMRKLGPCAIRPKHNTSKPHPEHRIYPDLLRDKTIVPSRRRVGGWNNRASRRSAQPPKSAAKMPGNVRRRSARQGIKRRLCHSRHL